MIFIKDTKLSPPEKWILLGIPALFSIGTLFHFLFNLSGKMYIIGAISAVNESVWEHMKMILLPIIIWWVVYFLLKGKKYNLDSDRWFTALLVSLVSALLTVPFLFYFYTQAFGVELLLIDILILLIADLVGQLMGLHFYKYSKGIKSYVSILIFVLIVLTFVVFTFYPPNLPIFYDSSSGSYGIYG